MLLEARPLPGYHCSWDGFILNCAQACVQYPQKLPSAAPSISKEQAYKIWQQCKRRILIEFLKR